MTIAIVLQSNMSFLGIFLVNQLSLKGLEDKKIPDMGGMEKERGFEKEGGGKPMT